MRFLRACTHASGAVVIDNNEQGFNRFITVEPNKTKKGLTSEPKKMLTTQNDGPRWKIKCKKKLDDVHQRQILHEW